MITHYGLYWSAADVFWGAQKKRGLLLGCEGQLPKKHRGWIDKETAESYTNYRDYVGIYCLYQEFNLIYVGEAGLNDKGRNIFERLKDHKNNIGNRWNKFSWFGTDKKNLKSEHGGDNLFFST